MLRAFLIMLVLGCTGRALAQETSNTSHLKKPVSTAAVLKIDSLNPQFATFQRGDLTFKTKHQLEETQKIIQLLEKISKMWYNESRGSNASNQKH